MHCYQSLEELLRNVDFKKAVLIIERRAKEGLLANVQTGGIMKFKMNFPQGDP